ARPDGIMGFGVGTDPLGRTIWWFDDITGNERGRWMVEPFEGGEVTEAAPGLEPGYWAGAAVAVDFAVIGWADRGLHRIYVTNGGEPRLLYEHHEAATAGGLSRDEQLLAFSHSEHGDSRNRALRVVTLDGSVVADLWDGPGPGLG